tara:strand:- start:258 stop:500 length:243 start_codon:yes stop_codon:yes gene_type:complete
MQLIEVTDTDIQNDDPTKRRVEVTVHWTKEDTRVFDVPADMNLDEVADAVDEVTWTPTDSGWGAWYIQDQTTEEDWHFMD